MATTTSYSNWNFYNQRVQQEVDAGTFISAETTLIAAGPANLTSVDTSNNGTIITAGDTNDFEAYPIGLLESFGLQQNKQLQRIFEIGSSRSYFIPGRVIGSIALGRTYYHGPNLLRALYAYYSQSESGSVYSSTAHEGTKLVSGGKAYTAARIPGYDEDHFYIDLASAMFSQPTGMAVYFKGYDNTTASAFYLENCYVQGHQLNVSSGSVLVMEGAQLQYDQLIPIKVA